jgi:putative isomerase
LASNKYINIIKDNIYSNFKEMLREPEGSLEFHYIVPGSQQYMNQLWDWDSWLTNVALRQIVLELGDKSLCEDMMKYERGCILNFLAFGNMKGWLPIMISPQHVVGKLPEDVYNNNMHKPVLAQHAAFLVRNYGGDAEWLREKFYYLQTFVNKYKNHHRHKCGLYYWEDDCSIGVDNDPCTYFRPAKSSGSIFLNCLMVKELEAMVYLCNSLDLSEVAVCYERDLQELKDALQKNCWDERDGFFYSVDLNLLPNNNVTKLHNGAPRDWDCLIQRIGVWSGFLALWCGIATEDQAKRIVEEHYSNPKTFNAPAGVRTLSKMEKMYDLRATGNPSNWLGPIWGISNYMTFRGLVKYGFEKEARELAQKTVGLFGRDFERFGALHEYYQPENGEPMLNRGFQNWNYLVLNMAAWLEGKEYVAEF